MVRNVLSLECLGNTHDSIFDAGQTISQDDTYKLFVLKESNIVLMRFTSG